MIVLLNPVFNCSNHLLSFSADRITTGTYTLQRVIANAAPVRALIASTGGSAERAASIVAVSVKIQFSYHVKIRFTSQLINGISDVLQILIRYFNVTENLTSIVFPLLGDFPVILVLYLKDSESVIGSVKISL